MIYELCQNTLDSSTRRVSVVRGSDGRGKGKIKNFTHVDFYGIIS